MSNTSMANTSSSKKKLAIVISHPIQHYVPVYQLLAKEKCLDVQVFFLAENGLKSYKDPGFSQTIEWDLPLTQSYEYTFIEPGRVLSSFGFFEVDSKKLQAHLKEFSPDFIWLHGYGQRINWRILRSKKAKLIYTSDSNLSQDRPWWRKVLKQIMVRQFFRKIDYFVAFGDRNKQYLNNYGVTDNQIRVTAFPIDMKRFIAQRDAIKPEQLKALRETLKIAETTKILLYAGKLVDYKRPKDLIYALAKLREEDVAAVFVGSGEQSVLLKELSIDLGVQDKVYFIGFINQSKIGVYLSLADIFIFPSAKEPYGAIASETLPFCLPIVASDVIGAIDSSILPNQNALIFEPGDVRALSQHISTLLKDSNLAASFSAKSGELAEEHDASRLAELLTNICVHG